jgi:hypothetical protein
MQCPVEGYVDLYNPSSYPFTVHRNTLLPIGEFLIISKLDALIFQIFFGLKLYMFRKVYLLASKIRMELYSILILLASCQQTCMTYTIAVCTGKNSWWWTEELFQIFICSMHFYVVLCIICFVSFSVLFMCICVLNYCHRVATQLELNISYQIYHNARSHERQIYQVKTWNFTGELLMLIANRPQNVRLRTDISLSLHLKPCFTSSCHNILDEDIMVLAGVYGGRSPTWNSI